MLSIRLSAICRIYTVALILTTDRGVIRKCVGGVQNSSGFPFTVSVFGDTANAGSLLNVNPIRANVVPGVSPEVEHPNADMWFNTAAFVTPPPFTFGTATRNSLWGPGLKKADLALDREIPLDGALKFHFRLEAFNLQHGQLRHAEPLREYAPVRHDHRRRHLGAPDPVCLPRDLLGVSGARILDRQ